MTSSDSAASRAVWRSFRREPGEWRLPTRSAPWAQGFTLIELLVAIAMVALLASLSYPSYAEFMRRSRISAALGELSAARVRLEQYYQDNRNYGSSAIGCGVGMPQAPGFDLACRWGDTTTSQSFVMTATGQAGAGLAGYAYTINHRDEQVTTHFAGVAVHAACWLKRKGETC